ncbi:unnamed protein product [Phytophthora lilii]|uniref:Unnamed protein product n=1 Tax=Phytophthora lilii TaxID=2077276 RepID=A0A9W6TGS2_9STRA|nr:unnamed protein product [Phytophthora lilii]
MTIQTCSYCIARQCSSPYHVSLVALVVLAVSSATFLSALASAELRNAPLNLCSLMPNSDTDELVLLADADDRQLKGIADSSPVPQAGSSAEDRAWHLSRSLGKSNDKVKKALGLENLSAFSMKQKPN